MIECKKIFIDTAPFIYLLDETPQYVSLMQQVFLDCLKNNTAMVTSTVTITEYLVLPYRTNNLVKIKNFADFIRDTNIFVMPISREIAELAAKLRAENSTLKSMDVLQLATAIHTQCEVLITNDKKLAQNKQIKCILANEW